MTKENSSESGSTDISSEPQKHRQGKHQNATPQDSWWVEILKILGLSVALALGIRTFAVEPRFIPTGSMEPTLMVDDRLFVEKVTYWFAAPARGDIIVFSAPDALQQRDAFIKRIIGLPGDQVAISNSRVYVNGQPLSEKYLDPNIQTTVDKCGNPAFLSTPQVIPPDSYLVLGDNRDDSFDGRCWGVVPRNHIIGRAGFLFWPPGRFGLIPTTRNE
jgi:signal peptidase I